FLQFSLSAIRHSLIMEVYEYERELNGSSMFNTSTKDPKNILDEIIDMAYENVNKHTETNRLGECSKRIRGRLPIITDYLADYHLELINEVGQYFYSKT